MAASLEKELSENIVLYEKTESENRFIMIQERMKGVPILAVSLFPFLDSKIVRKCIT
jgi:hypothetical protein